MDRNWFRAAAALTAIVAIAATASLRPRRLAAESAPPVPALLSETGLYAPGRVGSVDARNRRFSPQYPLWSDGATKTRWVFIPAGATFGARGEGAWEFPIGTRFWKEFAFDGRKVETRMLWKVAPARWEAVSYIWNEAQTDAALASPLGEPGVVALTGGRRHSIPSSSDCLACHGSKRTEPLGFNPLQLSTDRDPNAIHAESPAPGSLTLRSLVEEGLLTPSRADLVEAPPRIRTASPQTRRMLGYFAANCGSCHRGDGEIAIGMPSLHYSNLLRDGDASAMSLVGRATSWQVPGARSGASALIDSGAPDSSAMLVRMRSRSPSSQMPPLGTVLRDQVALEAFAQWIRSDLAALRR